MKNKLGFTLIELLVSISIIAILTVTISISFSKAQKNGRDTRRKGDMKMVQNAAEQFHLLNNSNYPNGISSTPWTSTDGQMILQSFPSDPKSGNDSSWSYNPVSSNQDGYCICATMENLGGNSGGSNCNDLSKTNGSHFCILNQQ